MEKKMSNGFILKRLNECYIQKTTASFYCDKTDNQVHLTGIVTCFNDQELLISHITRRGEYDGFIWVRLDDLYRIDRNGSYEKKIERLYKSKRQIHTDTDFESNDILRQLLCFANENKYIVSLELEEDMIVGFVDRCDENGVEISQVNDYGEKDGITVVSFDELINVKCDSDYEQDLKLLFELNYR